MHQDIHLGHIKRCVEISSIWYDLSRQIWIPLLYTCHITNWRNTIWNLNKYIFQFGQKYFILHISNIWYNLSFRSEFICYTQCTCHITNWKYVICRLDKYILLFDQNSLYFVQIYFILRRNLKYLIRLGRSDLIAGSSEFLRNIHVTSHPVNTDDMCNTYVISQTEHRHIKHIRHISPSKHRLQK